MTIRTIYIFVFAFCFYTHSFSQERISRDADGNIWLVTDTIRNIMQYINSNGNSIEVTEEKDFMQKKTELDSLIMLNQYDLWSSKEGYEYYEPYASVVYSILFSKKMKIIEVRILKREAYKKDPIIDDIIIKAIKKTKKIWKKNKSIKNDKNLIFVSRTRVVMPYITL